MSLTFRIVEPGDPDYPSAEDVAEADKILDAMERLGRIADTWTYCASSSAR